LALITNQQIAGGRSGLALAGICRQQSISPSHYSPVIFVGISAKQTYLVVAAMGVDARPGEPV